MNVLVTGAAGFIGSSLCDELLRRGCGVLGIDNFDPYYPEEIKRRNLESSNRDNNFRFSSLDIRDGASVADFVRSNGGVDCIVHLAAKAGVRPSIEDPIGYQEYNVKGTQSMLEVAKALGVNQFVFASSSSVYGVNPQVPWVESDAVLQPISPYASTKVSGELLGHVYSHLYGIRFVGLRFFTVYGPRQRPDLAISKFCRRILLGQPIPFFGDGSTRRDYTYISDIVEGIISAIAFEASPYAVINLGNCNTISLSEMVQVLEEALGKKAKLDLQPEQPGDVRQTWADLSRAASTLGYSPKVNFRDGVSRYVSWFRETNTPWG